MRLECLPRARREGVRRCARTESRTGRRAALRAREGRGGAARGRGRRAARGGPAVDVTSRLALEIANPQNHSACRVVSRLIDAVVSALCRLGALHTTALTGLA